MKLVIDISEEIVESVKYGNVYIAGTRSNGKTIFCKITDAIANATSLTDCTNAISRSAVMKLLESRYSSDTIMSIYEEVLELPSVNPTRPKAKWIEIVKEHKCYGRDDTYTTTEYQCSACGAKPLAKYASDEAGDAFSAFCPNCGAEMESEDKE